MRGNRVRSNGAGVLLGEDDTPPPSMFGTTMKYFSGFKARSRPIRAASAPLWSPLNHVGETMTLSRAGESVPQVLKPSRASGSEPPFWRAKFFAEKNSRSPISPSKHSCLDKTQAKDMPVGLLLCGLPEQRTHGHAIPFACTKFKSMS